MTTPVSAITCPACGTSAAGHFCSSCGATLGGGPCPECATVLSPGARFCHRCGSSAVGAASTKKSADSALPWAVAAIALVALTALVAGQQFRGRSSAETTPPASRGMTDGIVRAPDISQMTPAQRAELLFDRIMRLSESGQSDSVRFFAPMAIAAFQQMPEPLDADQRYDLGRIGIVTGLSELARAQSDTILAGHPDHLLGLALAISTAQLERDRVREQVLRKRLVAARPGEMVKNLPEYQRHQTDISEALSATGRP